jgi:hypothetical protein
MEWVGNELMRHLLREHRAGAAGATVAKAAAETEQR